MSKFRVGDRVRYIEHFSRTVDPKYFQIGDCYTVDSFCSGEGLFLSGIEVFVLPKQLELVADPTLEDVFSQQVDGNHYSKLKIQPMEYCLANHLNYGQSNAIKYITRYADKNGKQDLEKAIHCIKLLMEHEYGDEK